MESKHDLGYFNENNSHSEILRTSWNYNPKRINKNEKLTPMFSNIEMDKQGTCKGVSHLPRVYSNNLYNNEFDTLKKNISSQSCIYNNNENLHHNLLPCFLDTSNKDKPNITLPENRNLTITKSKYNTNDFKSIKINLQEAFNSQQNSLFDPEAKNNFVQTSHTIVSSASGSQDSQSPKMSSQMTVNSCLIDAFNNKTQLLLDNKINNEKYSTLAVRKPKKPTSKDNSIVKENEAFVSQQAYIREKEFIENFYPKKKKRQINSVQHIQVLDYNLFDSDTSQTTTFRLLKDNDVGIKKLWQAHIHKCDVDQDVLSDEERIISGHRICLNELRESITHIKSNNFEVSNIEYISMQNDQD